VRVTWTPEAEQDRSEIFEYIASNNPRVAVRMDELFGLAASRLGSHPRMGRVGLIAGTWELIPHESICLVYEIEDEVVWILALVHTARLWPPPKR